MRRRQHGQMGSERTSSVASSRRMLRIESAVWRSGRTGRSARDEVLGSWRSAQRDVGRADRTVFFGAAREARAHQESVCGDGQRGVVMEAAPVAAFVMIEPEFLFELLVVAFDAPAQLDEADQ